MGVQIYYTSYMKINVTKRIWRNMKYRCDNPKNSRYKYYGEKGISYSKRWKSFELFLKDMGERPDGLSLDRIDNSKNYSKENCRWATQFEQNRNTTRNVIFNGECAYDASMRLGNYPNLVQKRIKRGWEIEKAFITPNSRS